MIDYLIRAAVRRPVITFAIVIAVLFAGRHAWQTKTVDAIPDISENQVIVQARWPGRSPQDVEDQVTHPLATGLAGVRGVKEVRSLSGFGFSQVLVVFEEPIRLLPSGAVDDFYEARTRVLEKLPTFASDLPAGVIPELGPDATALGQVFMYTVEGPLDLGELRSLQDFVVRYELQSVAGVAEVASIGGRVRQYQVDLDPEKLRYFGASIGDVVAAIQRSNLDVGAKTIESAGAEYVVRGRGLIRGVKDVEDVTIGTMSADGFRSHGGMPMSMPMSSRASSSSPIPQTSHPRSHRPVLVRDVGQVVIGPEFRRGALTDDRGERVGGVVAMRFGENPREVIRGLRRTIARLNDPSRGVLPEGVRIVPFYDRTQLIEETVATLEEALVDELVITLIVVLIFLLHVRTSLIVAATLPLAVLASFFLMDRLGVDSNLMSLTGVAIAIGTMVDMAIVMTENIYRRLQESKGERSVREVVEDAACEVGPALATAVATTVVSFLPIFFLTDQEGKLFRPLAWTKTLALMTAAATGLFVVPVVCRYVLVKRPTARMSRDGLRRGVVVLGAFGLAIAATRWIETSWSPAFMFVASFAIALLVLWRLSVERLVSIDDNPTSRFIHRIYDPTLRWVLDHKATFLVAPVMIVVTASVVVVGGERVTRSTKPVLGSAASELRPLAWLERTFPGLGQEFMPSLDEGSLLYMPSLLPQASMNEALRVMARQNAMMRTVPEVARVVGKIGRTDSALDPAPVGMIETVVVLKSKDEWRAGRRKSDIVEELIRCTHTPGVLEGAGAWIQPIETRVIMLNAGIRAPLAVKLIGSPRGDDGRSMDARAGTLALERVATRIRDVIAAVPGVAGANVETLGGKPYVEMIVDREKVGHYGLTVGDVQEAFRTAIGGTVIDHTIEGRERYGIRVAYDRERRSRIEDLGRVVVRGSGGADVPLSLVARVETVIGPAAIKTEDGRLRLHVTFAAAGRDEGSVMQDVMARVATWRDEERRAGRGDPLPPGVDATAAGRYESQARARRRFAVLIPVCVAVIFFLLYLRFRSWFVCLNIFAAVPVCVAGGLLLLAFFPAVKDFMFSIGLWDAPSDGPIHVTVAVIVGFIALAGIATDDGVVMATYLEQTFAKRTPASREEIRDAVLVAGRRRIRPCLMTTFTTILALYPILASTGRGSDVAQPMAIPAVGGMMAGLISLFVVPTVYCWGMEWKILRGGGRR